MPVIRIIDNWSCFIFLLCLWSVKGKLVQHQHYHSKPTVHGTDIKITFSDGDYKPAVGEILAKDSILYSQKPESRLLRRQLWPIMQETMNELVDSVTVGANLFKNMLTANKNQIATKIRNIKNAYISAASTSTHKKNTKTSNSKKSKKPTVKHSPGRSKTVSGDYIHTYNDGAYTVPSYVIKSAAKNPYAQMGMKDYKHFEETVLRELEEKEEKKVEATMHTLFAKKPKNIEEQLIQGIPYDGWRPVRSHVVDKAAELNKPKPVGRLHTSIVDFNDAKPIHESVDESKTISQIYKTNIERPSSLSNSRRRKPTYRSGHSTTSSTTTTMSPPRPFTRKSTIGDPNYPEYFLKNHKELTSNNENFKIETKDMSSPEINYLKRMKYYREHIESFTTPSSSATTSRSSNSMRESLLIDESNQHSVFITPLPEVAENMKIDERKNRRLNRHQNQMKTADGNNAETSNVRNRGSIKFGDRL